jgi:flagellar protein FliS
MMPSNPYAAYLEASVLTADPVELVRILYRGALDALRDARLHLAAGHIEERSKAITKALDIIRELALSLDHKSEPVLARNLTELYDYMQRRLLAANLEQAEEPLVEVSGLLDTVLEAWERVNAPAPVEEPEPVAV